MCILSRSILVQRDSANCFSPLMKTALVPFHRPPPVSAGRSGLKYDTKVTIATGGTICPPPPLFSLSLRVLDFADVLGEARPRAISAGPTYRIADGPVVSTARCLARENYSREIRGLRRILEDFGCATMRIYNRIIAAQIV